jgi:hypothetical protein
MARNLPLPEVKIDGPPPYVLAAKFPDGSVGVATEGRARSGASWYHPRADITLRGIEAGKPIGIFGHYRSLTLVLEQPLSAGTKIWAQDLLADQATDITELINIDSSQLTIPGELIDELGTMARDEGDQSVPGLVIKIE